MGYTRKSAQSKHPYYKDQHRFEHWYRDNQVYFITARCRGQFPAFASPRAKDVFWQAFDKYTQSCGFVPWVTSLLDNHYHTLGYLRFGDNLPKLMQGLHGSTAKQVNDLLEAGGVCAGGLKSPRHVPFWSDTKNKNYFDGCIRDEKQCRLAYRYTLVQSQRHGVCGDYRQYAHTRVNIELERGVKRAMELGAFLEGVRYKRYEQKRGD